MKPGWETFTRPPRRPRWKQAEDQEPPPLPSTVTFRPGELPTHVQTDRPAIARIKELRHLPNNIPEIQPVQRCHKLAPTRKARVWVRELEALGHEVFVYDSFGNPLPVVEVPLGENAPPGTWNKARVSWRQICQTVRYYGLDPEEFPEWVEPDRDLRCMANALNGGKYCMMHGGNSERNQTALRERLYELAEPAVETLGLALEYPGAVQRSQIQVAEKLLDRLGVKASPGEQEGSPFGGWDLSQLTTEELQEFNAFYEKIREKIRRVDEDGLVIDAEVIGEGGDGDKEAGGGG